MSQEDISQQISNEDGEASSVALAAASETEASTSCHPVVANVGSNVIEVLGSTLWRTAAGHVLTIKYPPTCMGKVPFLKELVSYSAPTIRSTWENQHLINVFVNNGLTDFSDHALWTECYDGPSTRISSMHICFQRQDDAMPGPASFQAQADPGRRCIAWLSLESLWLSSNISGGIRRKLVKDA